MKTVKSICLTLLILGTGFPSVQAQTEEKQVKPTVEYSRIPRSYTIGGISVEGAKNYDDYMLIGLSGLTVGQKVNIPGEEITDAVKRFWRNGLFSNVSIEADSVVGDKVYLCIKLTQRPRVSQINYSGVKKGEREDLENRIGLLKDNQLTPNMIDRAKFLIKKYFDEKGYKNAEIEILQRDDVTAPDKTIVDIRIDKKEKVKIHSITIEGNHALSTKKIKGTMFVPGVFKKTNEKGRPGSWFRTKKFIEEKYKEDKENLIKKYNELAKEAHGNGNYVEMEVFRQYAEHYRKIVTEINEKKNQNQNRPQEKRFENQEEAGAPVCNDNAETGENAGNVVEMPVAETVVQSPRREFKVIEISSAEANAAVAAQGETVPAGAEQPKAKRTYRKKAAAAAV